ncbi:MAG: SurA N-terminal domain-containing protein [Bacteroidales bacterium]|nr:SurA N-terminal domain-containing protein [Bacteroidales bacterium]
MATLERIRNRAGVLVAVVIGFALFAFILGDFISSGGSLLNRSKMEIAEIGGNSISYDQYQAMVTENENLQKMFSQKLSLDEQTTLRIREQVWQDLIRQYALDPEFSKLGLDVSADELLDMVEGRNINPIIKQQFSNPQTGQFNPEYVTNFIKHMDQDSRSKTYWLFLEKEIKKDRLLNKYLNLIRKGLYTTDLEAKQAVADRFNKVNIDYSVVRYSTIPDSTITVSESAIESYYNDHKNDYKQTASRDIEYIIFPVKPSANDENDAKEWIDKTMPEFVASEDPNQFVTLKSDTPLDSKYYKRNEVPQEFKEWAQNAKKGDSFGPLFDGASYKIVVLANSKMMPDSVKARHILVAPKGQSQQDYEKAKTLADSLKTVLEKGGKWDVLTQKYSDDPGSKDKGGDLGWFASGVMVPAFEDAAFNNPVGKINVVESRFGFHVLEVTARSKEVNKVQLAVLNRKVVPSSTTDQQVYSEANLFAGKNRSLDKFKTAAQAKGYTPRIASNLMQNDRNIAGLESPREIIRWAFQSKQGEVSKVFQLTDMYIVATLTSVKEDGFAPIEQVKSDLKLKVIRKLKAEKLAEQVKQEITGAKTIADIAQKQNTTVDHADNVSFSMFTLPNAGVEPKVIGTAIVSPEGKISNPVEGNAGVYVLAVTAQNKEEGNPEMEKQRIANSFQSRVYYDAYDALKEAANIVDKRYNFY